MWNLCFKLSRMYISTMSMCLNLLLSKELPLKIIRPCSAQEAARVIAIMRLVMPDINISSAAGWNQRILPRP
ncbi:hypothetical protein [Desulfosporosinus shakirovi]|uniref:hypothetical protein n=1 Tax=Desulfosporosinus shakirovi TaxID=2885154 RepID=UPI0037BE6230